MKTINLEIQVPDWANYVAVDVDGSAAVYEVEPIPNLNIGRWLLGSDRTYRSQVSFGNWVNTDWQQSLRKV